MPNNTTLSLSSTSTSLTATWAEVRLEDATNLTLNLSGIEETVMPRNLTIDWGDGSDIYDSKDGHLKKYSEDSIINEVLYGKISLILSKFYTHRFNPPSTTQVTNLTSQVRIEYTNDDITLIYIPIEVRVGSFYDSIGDLNIISTNLIPVSTNRVNFILSTDKDGYIVEVNN